MVHFLVSKHAMVWFTRVTFKCLDLLLDVSKQGISSIGVVLGGWEALVELRGKGLNNGKLWSALIYIDLSQEFPAKGVERTDYVLDPPPRLVTAVVHGIQDSRHGERSAV